MGEDYPAMDGSEQMRGADGTTGAEDGRCAPAADDAPAGHEAADGAPAGYEAPAIVYRAPLEATAAFCDPVEYGKTEGYCWLGPINS